MSIDPMQEIRAQLANRTRFDGENVTAAREQSEAFARLHQPGPEVSVSPADLGGLPGEWIAAPDARNDRVLLYFHGGGYFMGSLHTHRDRIARITGASGAVALSVDYRLAPEHPFPAAVEDAATAYGWLRAQGIEARHIAVAGDSAGGGLALALLVHLRDQGLDLPAAGVLLSPWVDLDVTGASADLRAAEDPVLEPEELRTMGRIYLQGGDARDPLASPLQAELGGLPPLFVQVGTAEILFDDATRLVDKVRQAGGPAELDVWQDMIHGWHRYGRQLPQAVWASERAGAWVRKNIVDL